jgi:hypothetical protein
MVQWAGRTGAEEGGVHKATIATACQLVGDCLVTTGPVYWCGTPRGDSVRYQIIRTGASKIGSLGGM